MPCISAATIDLGWPTSAQSSRQLGPPSDRHCRSTVSWAHTPTASHLPCPSCHQPMQCQGTSIAADCTLGTVYIMRCQSHKRQTKSEQGQDSSPLLAWHSCKGALLVSKACVKQRYTLSITHTPDPVPHPAVLVARAVVTLLQDINSQVLHIWDASTTTQ